MDGGLHWETISAYLTGSTEAAEHSEAQGRQPSARQARRVRSCIHIGPSRSAPDLTGSNTGSIHLTKDGGKTWNNVSPPGLSDWSESRLIELAF